MGRDEHTGINIDAARGELGFAYMYVGTVDLPVHAVGGFLHVLMDCSATKHAQVFELSC